MLEAAMHKIDVSNPKISLLNCIDTPHNHTSNNMLSITDSGANIYLAKQATNIYFPSNNIKWKDSKTTSW